MTAAGRQQDATTEAASAPLDVLIVGAGPCGLAVAIAAKERGLTHAILDRGCITESLTQYPSYMTFFSTAERLEIGGVPFTIPDPKPTRREALAYYRHVAAHHGLAVRQYEEVTRIERTGGGIFTAHTRRRNRERGRWTARAVVIATGGFGEPNRLAFESGRKTSRPSGDDAARADRPDEPGATRDGGEDARLGAEDVRAGGHVGDGGENAPAGDRVLHYYREPYPFFDQDVVVVGGGNSAVEAALDLCRNGVRVRMVHFATSLDRGVKPWVRPDIRNRIRSGEIVMHWRSRVTAIGPRTATIARVQGPEDGGDAEAGDETSVGRGTGHATGSDTRHLSGPETIARAATEASAAAGAETATGAGAGSYDRASTEVPADWVLALTGWRPDSSLLEGLGVPVDPRTGVPAHDPATMQTPSPGVYVAGVLAAGFDANRIFIENGREHGTLIATHLTRPSRSPSSRSTTP